MNRHTRGGGRRAKGEGGTVNIAKRKQIWKLSFGCYIRGVNIWEDSFRDIRGM